jgi:outer membrane protein OmpA-like peptidoglycan-associated protein
LVPELAAGTYSMKLFSSFGRLDLQDSLIAINEPAAPKPSSAVAGKAKINILFAGDSSKLTKTAKASLEKFVKTNSLGKKSSLRLSSVGYTKFVAGTNNDASLSRARAAALINYLKKLGVKTTTSFKGAGISPIKSDLARKAVLTAFWK